MSIIVASVHSPICKLDSDSSGHCVGTASRHRGCKWCWIANARGLRPTSYPLLNPGNPWIVMTSGVKCQIMTAKRSAKYPLVSAGSGAICCSLPWMGMNCDLGTRRPAQAYKCTASPRKVHRRCTVCAGSSSYRPAQQYDLPIDIQ